MIPEEIKQKIDDYCEQKKVSIKEVKSLHGKTQLMYAAWHGYELAQEEIERLKGENARLQHLLDSITKQTHNL